MLLWHRQLKISKLNKCMKKMETDVDSHLQFLEGRLDYLNQHNQLNQ